MFLESNHQQLSGKLSEIGEKRQINKVNGPGTVHSYPEKISGQRIEPGLDEAGALFSKIKLHA